MTDHLSTVDGRSVLRMQRRLCHPQGKVWRAITTPEHLAKWFPFAVDLDLHVDAKITFTEHGGGTVSTDGVITELDPPRLFAFTWGDDLLRWELRPDGDGCVLTLTHTFDDRAGAASFASGWHTCIEALDASLRGETMRLPQTMPEIAELHEARVKAFGLDQGSAERTPDGWLVRFERQLTRPADAVWALLAGSQVPADGTAPADGPPPADGTAPADGPPPADGTAPVVGAPPPPGFTVDGVPVGPVTAVEAQRLLAYRVHPAGEVRWELREGTGQGARLVLTHTGATDREPALTAWHDRVERLAADLATA